ncbi:hypothetical protein [Enterobacter bugandensis]|uniref:hypothetical protein n=1 Tax=Enterobacter bugandensis TaxID=881260 RepID=UPI0015F4BD99|nr:hypothetical protein [Enterobacter bugandensis]
MSLSINNGALGAMTHTGTAASALALSAPSGGKRGFLMAELFSSKAENYEFV